MASYNQISDDLVMLDWTDNGPIVAAGDLPILELPPHATSAVIEVVPKGATTVTLQVKDGSPGNLNPCADTQNGTQIITNASGPFKFTVNNLVGSGITLNLSNLTGTISGLKAYFHPSVKAQATGPATYGGTGGVQSYQPHGGGGGSSGANAVQQVVMALSTLNQLLDIIMFTSGGTSTLLVEVSLDNNTWYQVDSFAAAAKTVVHYTPGVVGNNNANTLGSYAVCPLSFPFVRVTAGAAGIGNTNSLVIASK